MTNIEVRLRSCYNTLSDAEKKAADYFFKKPQDVCNLAISELAKRSGVSSTAWVRLCKSAGYSGVKDMRKQLYADGASAPKPVLASDVHFADIGAEYSVDQIIHAVSTSSTQAVRDTAKLLGKKELKRAAELILNADTVRLFGVGASALVAEDLYQKLVRINLHAIFSRDSHVQLSYSSTTRKNDVAIFVSNTGSTRETLETLEAVKKCGCATIGITRYAKSQLASKCDVLLYTTSPEVYVRSGAMSSRIAQLIAVDILFTIIASKNYDNVEQALEESYKICQTHIVGD